MHFIYFSSVFFHFERHSNASRNCLSNARRRSRWGKNGKAFICSRITLLILRHIDITSSSRAPNMTGIRTASIKYTRSILCFNFLAHIAWVITNKILLSWMALVSKFIWNIECWSWLCTVRKSNFPHLFHFFKTRIFAFG